MHKFKTIEIIRISRLNVFFFLLNVSLKKYIHCSILCYLTSSLSLFLISFFLLAKFVLNERFAFDKTSKGRLNIKNKNKEKTTTKYNKSKVNY